MRIIFLLVIALPFISAGYDPTQWKDFLQANKMKQCGDRPEEPRMPRSFYVTATYFDSIPLAQRVAPSQRWATPVRVPSCNKIVQPAQMDAYSFQSERFLSTLGLNIYDGSLYSMAVSLLGDIVSAIAYESSFLGQSATCQFKDTRGDAACKGVIVTNQCSDPNQTGYCGFCYNGTTLPKATAWSFRMLSDYWALNGTVDARCPELGLQWTWNDYKPVLGENAWASLIGPLQVAFLKYGQAASIPDNDISLALSFNFLTSVQKMISPLGGIYYAPKNTISTPQGKATIDLGFDLSVENNISLLAGLRALRNVLVKKSFRLDLLPIIDGIINGILNFVKSSYDPSLGFFRQGGSYDPISNQFNWHTGNDTFAVDCQTWSMSVIGPKQVDQWYGAGTAAAIWETTKKLGGYHWMFDGSVDGLGFSYNSDDQVFSGEWTLGGINMCRIFASELGDTKYNTEADNMRLNIQTKLTDKATIDGIPTFGVRYASKRYWIPFGWFANPILSTASTAWAVMADYNWNPFYLGGAYKVDY